MAEPDQADRYGVADAADRSRLERNPGPAPWWAPTVVVKKNEYRPHGKMAMEAHHRGEQAGH